MKRHVAAVTEEEDVEACASPDIDTIKKEICEVMEAQILGGGEYTIGGKLSEADLSPVPLMNIRGFGILAFPLNPVTMISILKQLTQSKSGTEGLHI